MYKLVIEDDQNRVTEVPLDQEQISIGRREGSDIRLDERNVSRTHARVRTRGGKVYLEDLESSYGVRVNGERMGGSAILRTGDHFRVGDFRLTLEPTRRRRLGAQDDPAWEGATDPQVPSVAGGDGPDLEDLDTQELPAHGASPESGGDEAPPDGPPSLLLPRLVGVSPEVAGVTIPFDQHSIVLGHGDEVDLRIAHPSLNRVHAELRYNGRQCSVVGLGSAGGVLVNGDETGACDLLHGDVVHVGALRFRFDWPAGGASPGRPARRASGATRTLVAALSLALVASLVALIVLLATDEPVEVTPSAGDNSGVVARVGGGDPSPALKQAVATATRLMQQRSWQQAIDTLSRAMMDHPQGTGAADELRARAMAERRAEHALASLRSLLKHGNLELAKQRQADIPVESVYRAEADRAIEQYGQRVARMALLLDRARRMHDAGRHAEALAIIGEVESADPDNFEAARLKFYVRRALRDAEGLPAGDPGGVEPPAPGEERALDVPPSGPETAPGGPPAAPVDDEGVPGAGAGPGPAVAPAASEPPEGDPAAPAPAAGDPTTPGVLKPGAPAAAPTEVPAAPAGAVLPRPAGTAPPVAPGAATTAAVDPPAQGTPSVGLGAAAHPAAGQLPTPAAAPPAATPVAVVQPGLAALDHVNRARQLRRAHRLAEAVAEYRSALALDGRLSRAHFGLGMLLVDMGRSSEACSHLAAFVRLQPASPDAATAQQRARGAGCGGAAAPAPTAPPQ